MPDAGRELAGAWCGGCGRYISEGHREGCAHGFGAGPQPPWVELTAPTRELKGAPMPESTPGRVCSPGPCRERTRYVESRMVYQHGCIVCGTIREVPKELTGLSRAQRQVNAPARVASKPSDDSAPSDAEVPHAAQFDAQTGTWHCLRCHGLDCATCRQMLSVPSRPSADSTPEAER